MLEKALRRYFVHLHGEGEPHQYDVYRCNNCGNLLTWRRIRQGKKCCSGRIVPTEPTLMEAIRLFLLPWTFNG